MNVLAIIPARGGSKGIKKKNIIDYKGKPLMQWSIDAALKSKYITEVVVSSDNDEILDLASKNKDIITLKRPKELAEDSSRTEPVLKHIIESLDASKYSHIILLQPTSPLRTVEHIDNAFKLLFNSEANSLISVCNLEHHPFKSFKIDKNGFLEGIINNDYPFYPRQSLPKTYKANGAIYIIEVDEFKKNFSLLTAKTIHFEMNKESSIDIDTLEDLK
ncbi:acylneuraminate cytidylyltransferase family protein [Polaribacter sp. SA4-12]|uniref:acylneuraminate cytidylyltransferase family protein n=1 Tax=Polaribacter sp. SA4-12 TaxID=1312072 RepID=UPI000B3D39EE|nr:acylneuraminate cytidylyltransferase family protein [Polaribacter sp. SA4-12]ARV13813.1 acylneuraminate cytidylyltransferase [Polaribacter sp. SA4-12]